jgi:hypothetical protein
VITGHIGGGGGGGGPPKLAVAVRSLVPSIVSVQVEPVVPEFEFAAEQSPDQPKKVSV